MVDQLGSALSEWHRQDVLRSAAQAKRRVGATSDAGAPAAPLLSRAARQRLHAARVGWEARPITAPDILGSWSGEDVARRPFGWPDWRTVLDWSLWGGLVVALGAAALARG